jgi:protein TonB
LAQKQQGTVVVRVVTDQSGKVTSCAVVLSSGVTSLDDVTCATALKRAKYKPAIGADGRRSSAMFINYSTFATDQ